MLDAHKAKQAHGAMSKSALEKRLLLHKALIKAAEEELLATNSIEAQQKLLDNKRQAKLIMRHLERLK